MISEINEKQIRNFTYNVAWLRKHHKLSKKKMAEILNISVNSLSKLEKDIIPPRLTIKIIFDIWDYFGIHPAKQFGQRLSD